MRCRMQSWKTRRLVVMDMYPLCRACNMAFVPCYCDPCEPYTDYLAIPDSWVEISSQPSSSSLSSINDDPATTGARVPNDARQRRRRTLRPGAPSHLNIASRAPSTSSQDEYEESESDDDRLMSSSGEGVAMPSQQQRGGRRSLGGNSSASEDNGQEQISEDDDDENRTAVNHPLRANGEACFTPQPNAFSHPPSSGSMRHASQPVVGSYFPSSRPPARHTGRQSLEARTPGHLPQNILSPSYNPSAAAQHDEALRASLSTLLSCAAAARGLPKSAEQQKRPQTAAPAQTSGQRGHRPEPMSFRLIPESAAPVNQPTSSPQQFQEPTFHPTLRRTSTSTSSSSSPHQQQASKEKRKANVRTRSTSRERRLKKARRGSAPDDLAVTPTLLTWVVSAGVVLFFSAVSFSAGYSLGKEAGRFEAGGVGGFASDDPAGFRGCAKEAGRSSLGLKRSLARSAVQV